MTSSYVTEISRKIREVTWEKPTRTILEVGSEFLSLQKMRNFRNFPGKIKEISEKISRIKTENSAHLTALMSPTSISDALGTAPSKSESKMASTFHILIFWISWNKNEISQLRDGSFCCHYFKAQPQSCVFILEICRHKSRCGTAAIIRCHRDTLWYSYIWSFCTWK